MRRIIPLVVALAAGPAAAQPSDHPCSVTIVRAPEDVRATVEAWVQRESSCGVSLEVRVVSTDGGLYLIARDDRGRTYERIVPDSQSAGVLVASWMADDSLPSTMSVTPIASAVAVPTVESPELVDAVPRRSKDALASHWLSLQATAGSSKGVRGELDVLTFGHWAVGATASVANGEMSMTAVSTNGFEDGAAEGTTDVKALAYLVRQIDLDQWHVRPAIAFGAMSTTVHIIDNDYPAMVMNQDLHGTTAIGEGSFFVTHDLGATWAIDGGVLVDLSGQQIAVARTDSLYANASRRPEFMLALGIGHRL